MPFEKGKPKTGGRQKGSVNKTTAELRQQMQAIVEATVKDLPAILEDMAPEERVKALSVILPYVLPKLSSVVISGDEDAWPIRVSLSLNPNKA